MTIKYKAELREFLYYEAQDCARPRLAIWTSFNAARLRTQSGSVSINLDLRSLAPNHFHSCFDFRTSSTIRVRFALGLLESGVAGD